LQHGKNGGATWTAFDAPIGQAACCDPGVAYAYDGALYAAVLDTSPAQALVIRSSNNGATWTAPVSLAITDRENIIVDNGISSPYRGRVYVTYSFAGVNQIGGFYSTNQGGTWAATGIIGGGNPFLGPGTGAPDSPETTAVTQIFDPATNAWQSGPSLNTARSFVDAAVVRNKNNSGSTQCITVAVNTACTGTPLVQYWLYLPVALYNSP
jgi:hypothetical protein